MISDFEKMLDALERKFPLLTEARVFLVALLVALAVGASGSYLFQSNIVAGLRKANTALKEQVDLYKARLQVGSPDEALKKFVELEKRIEALRPPAQRRLSDAQKQSLEIQLAPLASKIPMLFIFAESGAEQSRYLYDFVPIFKKIGVPFAGPVSAASIVESDKGLLVGLIDPKNPSELATQFIEALQKSGLTVGTTLWAVENNAGQLDFNLFVAAQ